MTTNFKVNGIGINTIFAAAGAADGSNNTLTGYTTGSGTAIKFLKPFYTGISSTTNETTYNGDTRMYATANFLSSSLNTKFCPSYVFYPGNTNNNNNYNSATSAISTVTPPEGVTRMLVLLVGGGGGGGGGASKSGAGGGGGGGGGGSGGISICSFPITNGSYTINIGYGGLYGYTVDNSVNGPGDEDSTSPNGNGSTGGMGVASSFLYDGSSCFALGGGGGTGGTSSFGGGGGGGAGAYASDTLLYSFTGNAGSNGSYASSGGSFAGGAGGKPKYDNIINKNLFNVISSQVSLTSNNISTSTKLQYGEGGNGGKGDNETTNWGINGEFGAPGCGFVFYFYN
jgi:hypothetical protein